MKKITISIFCMFYSLMVLGQSKEESIVWQFGENLSYWCLTKDFDFRMKAQNQCTDACRVKDKIMEDFVLNSGLDLRDYVVPNYLNGFEAALSKGQVSYSMSNVRTIYSSEQSYSFSYGTSTVKQEEKRSKDFITVACDITVTGGSMNYQIKDLYYVRKDKIVKITPYEEVIDQRTGQRKVKVDFSDLEDISMLGLSLNHDQNFPLGASIIGQSSWFLCSLDFGINFDSKKYIIDKVDMTDILNYSRTQKEYDPKMFLTVTPSVFLKYISIGCGVGFVWLSGNENTKDKRALFRQDGSLEGTVDSSISTNSAILEFMFRPQLRGYIPLSHSCNLSLGVGYDIVPKLKDLNGYNVSIGLHFDFEEWANLF